jgi:hypothetical protein
MIWFRKHEHGYQPSAVQNNNPSLFSSGMAPTTVILRRCSCGEVDAKTIAGRWTLAQVLGEPEPVVETAEAAR